MKTQEIKEITMVKINQVKKPGTKGVWIDESTKTTDITREQHKNIIEAAPFFRRLGGIESMKRGYCSAGFVVFECVSTSPDRLERIVRKFSFND